MQKSRKEVCPGRGSGSRGKTSRKGKPNRRGGKRYSVLSEDTTSVHSGYAKLRPYMLSIYSCAEKQDGTSSSGEEVCTGSFETGFDLAMWVRIANLFFTEVNGWVGRGK